MLALPSKPWKKVKIEPLTDQPGQRYRIVFLSELDSEDDFREIVEEDIRDILGTQDAIETADWPSRSVIVTTPDLAGLKRNLVFSCIMVELE